MKPNYKNWVPKGMVIGFLAGTAADAVALAIALNTLSGTLRTVLGIVLGILLAVLALLSIFFVNLYTTFSYDGKKQFARRIIEKVASYVELPEGGTGLDVGCGSAALTIACAKRNPQARMIGLDRWGVEYASFSKQLCESNARAEGVEDRVSFVQGDALKLNYPDGTFDAVTSNYCYHNIPSRDRQAILLETLRTLKKGGVFAIHDEFSKSKYGDMTQLVRKLQAMGYERVEFLDTTDGRFMTPREASMLGLHGSGLLVGKK